MRRRRCAFLTAGYCVAIAQSTRDVSTEASAISIQPIAERLKRSSPPAAIELISLFINPATYSSPEAGDRSIQRRPDGGGAYIMARRHLR